VQAFLKKFLERSGGKRPNAAAMAMYDEMFVAKSCIERSGVSNKPDDLEADRDRLAKCWAGLKDFEGLLGIITMNDVGVNVGPVWPLIVKRGQFTMAE
jgi:branched-chain amino acid transport system substrate-binding protein